MGGMASGAGRALKGMVTGLLPDTSHGVNGFVMDYTDRAFGPVLAFPKEGLALATGAPSSMAQHAREVIGGVKNLATPAAKTVFGGGAGTITPEEIKAAADTGGGAVAQLGTALVAPRVPAAVRWTAGPSRVATALRKVVKGAGSKAVGQYVGLPHGVGYLVGKAVLDVLPKLAEEKPAVFDRVLEAASKGDGVAVAESMAKVAEKDPDMAAAFSEAMRKSAPPAKLPPLRPAGEVLDEVAARRKAKIPVEGRPGAWDYTQEGMPSGVDAPQKTTGAGTPIVGRMPTPGNVKMATIYSNPKTPAGKPLTTAQRNQALIELQRKAAEDAGLDIFSAFGIDPVE